MYACVGMLFFDGRVYNIRSPMHGLSLQQLIGWLSRAFCISLK